jgi:predicted secreted Zn-dependent protease
MRLPALSALLRPSRPVFQAVCIACAFMWLAQPALADVSENLQYRYYPVSPQGNEALWQAMDRASPIRERGRVFRGDTRWQVVWNLRWEKSPSGRCALSRVQTTLRATITLPQISGDWDGETRARFTGYVTALRQHELKHVDSGRKAARAIDRRLSAFPVMSSCHALEQAANAAGFELLDQARQHDLTLDKRTGHGRSEGVVLPD